MREAPGIGEGHPTGSLLAKKGLGAPLTRPPDLRSLGSTGAPSLPNRTKDVILVLASDPFNAKVYRDLLDQRDYASVIEQNFRCWRAAFLKCAPSVILIDLNYHGHPSLNIAWRLMEDPRFQAIPTIALTDSVDKKGLSETATLIDNCDARIAKPVSVSGFYGAIDSVLEHVHAN